MNKNELRQMMLKLNLYQREKGVEEEEYGLINSIVSKLERLIDLIK